MAPPVARQKQNPPTDENIGDSDTSDEAGFLEETDESDQDDGVDLGQEFASIQEAFKVPVPSECSSIKEFTEYNKRAQLSLGEAIEAIRSLKVENTRLENRIKQLESRGKKKGKKTDKKKVSEKDEAEMTEEEKITRLGKQYLIFHELFPNPSAFGKAMPEEQSDDPLRFTTAKSSLRGQTAELYDFLPEEFHAHLQSSSLFQQKITNSASEFKRAHWHQLRSKTAQHIFDFLEPPSGIFATSRGDERANLPAFKEFRKFPGDPDDAIFRPLCFPNQEKNFKVIFRCDWLAKLLRSMFFGAMSIIGDNTKAPNSNGVLWNTDSVNAGVMALGLVSGLFMTGPDKSFAVIGPQSKINFQKAYNGYKSFIIEASRDGKSSQKRMLETIRWLNDRVFADGRSSNPDAARRSDTEDFSGALAAMSLSDESDSDEEYDARYPPGGYSQPRPVGAASLEPIPEEELSEAEHEGSFEYDEWDKVEEDVPVPEDEGVLEDVPVPEDEDVPENEIELLENAEAEQFVELSLGPQPVAKSSKKGGKKPSKKATKKASKVTANPEGVEPVEGASQPAVKLSKKPKNQVKPRPTSDEGPLVDKTQPGHRRGRSKGPTSSVNV